VLQKCGYVDTIDMYQKRVEKNQRNRHVSLTCRTNKLDENLNIMVKKVASIKHKTNKRVHIPSKEEAGYLDANAKVQDGKKVLELPKNPVLHSGQGPELFWLNKYGNDDRDNLLRVDIRSLSRHEHIAPETLIKSLYKVTETQSSQMNLFSVNELFGYALDKDEIEKVSENYHHQDGWTNRLIQDDSHLNQSVY